MDKTLLRVSNLRLGFAAGKKMLVAVNGISFAISKGETFALLGESGCGKSATAQGIMRLLPIAGRITGGSIKLEGEELLTLAEADMRRVRGARIAMIFQEPATSLNPVLTVGVQIGEVLDLHCGLRGEPARQRMLELLRQVGIADPERRLDEYPFQFSGGMKQRVMIAIALAGEPDLLIADEPTTALDVTVQAQILDLLAQLQRERGMGMLLITHDLGVVAKMAHRIGVMYAGELVEVADREEFFTRPRPGGSALGVRHPYTQALFAALPEVSRRGMALTTIPGQVPSLDAMPAGCRFADRCAHVMPVCREISPDWRSVAASHTLRCHWTGSAAEVADTPRLGLGDLMPEMAPFLDVADLKVHFPIRRGVLQRTVGHVLAVDGVSLAISAGRTLALVGESGCGKTTVGKALLQLVTPTAGSVRLGGSELVGMQGKRLRAARRHMQMVFQDPVRFAQPADAGRRNHRRRDECTGTRGRSGGAGGRSLGLAEAGWSAGRSRRALSARVFRRPAPAHRHRPCARRAAGTADLRRTDLGARRIGAGPDPQLAQEAAGRTRCRLPVHHPQLRGGRVSGQRCRGDVPRADRRAGCCARGAALAEASLHAGAAVGGTGTATGCAFGGDPPAR